MGPGPWRRQLGALGPGPMGPMGPMGPPWGPMGPHGASWGPNGAPWGPMGPHRALWGPKGPNFTLYPIFPCISPITLRGLANSRYTAEDTVLWSLQIHIIGFFAFLIITPQQVGRGKGKNTVAFLQLPAKVTVVASTPHPQISMLAMSSQGEQNIF